MELPLKATPPPRPCRRRLAAPDTPRLSNTEDFSASEPTFGPSMKRFKTQFIVLFTPSPNFIVYTIHPRELTHLEILDRGRGLCACRRVELLNRVRATPSKQKTPSIPATGRSSGRF